MQNSNVFGCCQRMCSCSLLLTKMVHTNLHAKCCLDRSDRLHRNLRGSRIWSNGQILTNQLPSAWMPLIASTESHVHTGADPGFWLGGASRILTRRGGPEPKICSNRGFSFKIPWKLHDFEEILGARGPGAQFWKQSPPTSFSSLPSSGNSYLYQISSDLLMQLPQDLTQPCEWTFLSLCLTKEPAFDQCTSSNTAALSACPDSFDDLITQPQGTQKLAGCLWRQIHFWHCRSSASGVEGDCNKLRDKRMSDEQRKICFIAQTCHQLISTRDNWISRFSQSRDRNFHRILCTMLATETGSSLLLGKLQSSQILSVCFFSKSISTLILSLLFPRS